MTSFLSQSHSISTPKFSQTPLSQPTSSVKIRRSPPISASLHIASPSMYEDLGIQAGASVQEIKSAYRKLARVLHPDVASVNGRNDSSADDFIRIQAAYATLSDPGKRADYDRTRVLGPQQRSASTTVTMSYSGFSGYGTGRSWETDQCW